MVKLKHRPCGMRVQAFTVKCPMAPKNGRSSSDVTCEVFGVSLLAMVA